MKYFATTAAIVSFIPRILSMTINTPTSVVQCQPQLLSWSDGTAPYYLTIIPGGQAAAAPLKTFPTQSGTSVTWMVDIAGGTSVTFALKDSTGATAYTDMVTIQAGSDSSCMSASQSSASPTAKAADAASSAAGVSSSASHAASAAASSAAVITRSSTIGAQATQSGSKAASTSGASGAAATTGTSASASGAQTKYSVGGYVVAGALGLLGATLL